MGLSLKPGVSILGISPEIVLAAIIVRDAFSGIDCVITSCTEGVHSMGSLHYIGHAFDLRLPNGPPKQVEDTIAKLRLNLGSDFDVIQEETHIHIEFQPKRPLNIPNPGAGTGQLKKEKEKI